MPQRTVEKQYCEMHKFVGFQTMVILDPYGLPYGVKLWCSECLLGMAIPRRISFLEESRSRGMTNLHSSGFEEYEIYSPGSSGNFEEWVIPKMLKIPQKLKKKKKKKISKKKSKERGE